MTITRRFDFSDDKQITAQKADNFANFLWIAFAKNSNGKCIIEKNGKFSPKQVYYSLNREVNNVNAMDLDSSKLYVAYEDATLLGEIISKINPLTSVTTISKGAIVESPIDVLINGIDLWFLLPGIASGTNAKLLKYDTSGVLQETVDLNKSGNIVNNAKSMTIDSNDDIWIVTYENPARLVRVYEMSGGVYDFTITEIV